MSIGDDQGDSTVLASTELVIRDEVLRAGIGYQVRRRGGVDGYDVVWNGYVAGWVWRKARHMGGRWVGLAFTRGDESVSTPVMRVDGMATWGSRESVALVSIVAAALGLPLYQSARGSKAAPETPSVPPQ